MPKYLFQVNYIAGDGVKELLKEGGTGRRATADQIFGSVGGSVEAFYYAFGETDLFIIASLTDNASAAAVALKIAAGGAVTIKTTVLITAEEVDQAAKKGVFYRPPGQ
jgi:uncharacterized protein with GYD domain